MADKTETDDALLMAAISGGDGNALRLLIRKYRQLVFRTALRIMCRSCEAEDITQDVFIKVWQQAGRYNGQSSLSTWLYRITANLSLDKLRRRKLIPSWISNGMSGKNGDRTEISAEDRLIASEEWEIFVKASEKLSPKQRMIFTLKEIEELDTEEVTRITGMNADQIKSNLYLARRTVRKIIMEYNHGKE